MMLKAFFLLAVLPLLTLKPGTCLLWPKKVCVKAGEMVTLHCPSTSETGPVLIQEMDLANMSTAKQRNKGVLVNGLSLTILSASAEHHGNYSCSVGNASIHFMVIVNAAPSRECEVIGYPQPCLTRRRCKLSCPDVNTPAKNPNITDNGIMWHKENESLENNGYFLTVEEKDHGVYTCTRSYLYNGQMYNMTFTVVLDIKNQDDEKTAAIISPHNNDIVYVDLGSQLEIDCKAVMYSEFDDVFWLRGDSTVEKNASLPVFSKHTKQKGNENEEITILSLVFKKVSEDDLTKNYTCKLEAVYQNSKFVTIRLQNARPSYVQLALSTVGIVVVMTTIVILYVKFKMDINLFFRDTLGCHRSLSDGKSYDAFMMSYKSNTDTGLNVHDRRWLEIVLEDKFGYRLCLHDRDVQLGNAVANTVLECIEESRTVVLVPSSLDPNLGSGLLSVIHEALVERQTRLIFIKTETTKETMAGSLPEALQFLSEAGDRVIWRGRSYSSAFLKQLRFYLPASTKELKRRLPQTI